MTELEYLPHSDLPTFDDVDWDSVMLYSSNRGSRLDSGGNYALTKQAPLINGGPPGYYNPWFQGSYVPSQADIRAVIQLYEAVDTRFEHRYFHDPHSEFFSRFNEMRNFSACDRDIQQPRTPTPP